MAGEEEFDPGRKVASETARRLVVRDLDEKVSSGDERDPVGEGVPE
jgi:hypothetical protein